MLARVAPGLFWIAVLLSAILAVQRSFAIETAHGARDGLRLSGLDPAAIFLGKAAAIAAQLFLLEVVLAVGVVILYDVTVTGAAVLLVHFGFWHIGHRRYGHHLRSFGRQHARPRNVIAPVVLAHCGAAFVGCRPRQRSSSWYQCRRRLGLASPAGAHSQLFIRPLAPLPLAL